LAVAWAVLFLLAGCGGSDKGAAVRDSGVKFSAAAAHRLDAALKEKVQDTGVPGASAAVVFADGEEWTGHAGDAVLKPRRPMTSHTALPFDGVTSVAVAALTMKLVEQGKLALADPISRWYRDWRGDPDATISDLLGHTSGLGDPPDAVLFRAGAQGKLVTPRQFVVAAGKPGPRTKDAVYSNAGFVVLGMIIERAAGQPVAEALRREVFDHPGGDGLALQPAQRTHAPRADSYWYPRGLDSRTTSNDGTAFLPSLTWTTMVWTAGALAGDVPSLARWGQALFNGKVVTRESLAEMATFHPVDEPRFWNGYGLGLAKYSFDGHDMWGHTGGSPTGSHTEFWHLLKEDMTIAVTWNDAVIGSEGGIFQGLVKAANG
jgi:D-alanyl-D-alanine carboxypeptidase